MKTINSLRSKLLTLTLALMASVSSFAYDFQDGYLFYNILADGTVAVTNERLGLPYNNLPASLVIPSEVTGNYGAKYQVSEIADYAFQGCDKLESLIIPNTVKKIGMYAFTGCSKLLNISFPESLEDVMAGALYECAWYDNQPDGLVYVGNLLYRYKGIAPTGVITINEGTKAVLGLAFSNQPNITSVILPESVTSVHMQAFGDCPNLESVTLPTWLSVIEDYTFQNCSKLQNINLPLGLDQIGKEAFAGCSSLTILDWPLQLKNIGARAFYNCNQLDGIENISPNIEKIGADAFCNTAWESKQPSGYLYIHNIFYAYTGEVTDSMHIEIKKGTTYISGGAVSRCVTKINEYSTKNVVSKITIPNSVTEIEDETFRSCRNLDTIICTSVQPPLISENTFNLTLQKNKHVLLVPTKALDIYSWMGLLPYEAAPYWNNFTNVKPITDPYVYDPMYFEKDSIQYHITNDTLAPYEVEVTHWYGLEQWEMERHNYPELTTANIPATVTYKGTTYLVTRIGKMAFYHASQLQRVTIGENVKTIDEQAFSVCRNLSHVVIGENVDSILLSAFASGNSKIKVLDIPKNVKYIDYKSLSAYSLEAINVHPDNANYTSVDGVLFNKQKNYLQDFPRSKATTYMVPDCVDTIGPSAFASNHNIVSISFSPNSQLKHIEKEAFMGCVFMQRLELPTSLQSIEERAFNNCCSLEAITSLNPTPPVMSNRYNYNQQVFGSVSQDIPLFVPAESVELYDAAPQWDRFGTILPIGTITMNDFPTLAGLQRTSFNAYMGSSLFSAETNIRYIKDKAYLDFHGYFLREENNQVLIYSRRLGKDLILYDYSLEVGDTLTTLNFDYRIEDVPLTDLVVDYPIPDPYGSYDPIDTLIVTNILYVTLLDGKEYKQWTFNNGMQYVEGIGQFGQSIWAGDFFALIRKPNGFTWPDTRDYLVCASKNGKLFYQMDAEEMERLGAECLCEVETSYKSQWCNQWNILAHGYLGPQEPLYGAKTTIYQLGEDTIINHLSYKQLTRYASDDVNQTKTYVGAIRFAKNNRQVYFYYDNAEYLLYDFKAQVGDTLEVFAGIDNYRDHKTYKHVVTNKEPIQDEQCKVTLDVFVQQELDGEIIHEEKFTSIWIEGVGSPDGIVHNCATLREGNVVTDVLCAYVDDRRMYRTPYPDYRILGCEYNDGDFIEDAFPMLSGLQRTVCKEYYGETEDDNSANSTYKQTFDQIFFENDKPYILCNDYLLREEDNKILIYSQLLNKDLVLYDFTLEVGDSLPALYIDYHARNAMDWMPYNLDVVDYYKSFDGTIYPADTFIVTDISNVTLFDGKEYKKWTFNNGMEYVEGIGSFGNRQWSGDFFQLIANRDVPTSLLGEHLVCASKNGKLFYQMDAEEMERLGAECLCDYDRGPRKDNAKDGQIGGRPTPTQWNQLEVVLRQMDNNHTILQAETFSYTLENDSIVANDKIFYQLARQSTKDTATTKSVVGALHFGKDEDNRVYFLRDGVEYVLYDFTAEIGDTVEIFAGINNYPQETTYTHVVVDKDTTEDGACRMFLEVVFPDETNASAENAEKVWLAGLGSVDGIVHNAAKRTSNAHAAPSRSDSSETESSVMLCAWREDSCLYTTNYPDYETFGCVYNQDPTSVEDISTSQSSYQKIIREGQFLILHNGKTYSVMGIEL